MYLQWVAATWMAKHGMRTVKVKCTKKPIIAQYLFGQRVLAEGIQHLVVTINAGFLTVTKKTFWASLCENVIPWQKLASLHILEPQTQCCTNPCRYLRCFYFIAYATTGSRQFTYFLPISKVPWMYGTSLFWSHILITESVYGGKVQEMETSDHWCHMTLPDHVTPVATSCHPLTKAEGFCRKFRNFSTINRLCD